MALRVVAARVVRLPLSDGDWIDVKAELNHGEYQAIYEGLYTVAPDGNIQRKPLQVAAAMITAYLVDWSARDLNDRPIVIRDLSRDEIGQRLNVLSQDSFTEIKEAIERHASAIEAARQEKKRTRTGADASLPTYESPPVVAGAMSG